MSTQLETYFDVIHRYTPMQALIGLTVIHNTHVNTRWYQRQHINKLYADARAVQQKANVYARITPLGRAPEIGRGIEAMSLGSSVLILDYDTYKNQLDGIEALQAYRNPPTMIVNSGNGLHAYWLLDRMYTDLEEIKARNKQIALDFGGKAEGGDSCFDLARVLRIPETFNVKYTTPLQCVIAFYDPSRIYKLMDFEAASIDDATIAVWDTEPLPADFIEALRERDPRLAKRIMSEDGAKKVDAAINGAGRVDRSRNDAHIATRLLALGYAPGICLSVLMSPDWFSGSKYREKQRYDYVVMTVNAALRAYSNSPDRYFAKSAFRAERLGDELTTGSVFVYAAGKLWRYSNGVYISDGEDFVKAEVVRRLGKRWSSRASDETLRWIVDQSRIYEDALNRHNGLINVQNGMIQLSSGELLPHDPKYLSTAQLPIEYDPRADTTAIDKFIGEILPHDTIAFFWEYVGSAFIRDHYTPKAFLSIIGKKDCGKSKIIEWLLHFYGDRNVATKAFQTLADNRFASAALFGKMANIFDDLDDQEAQNVGLIKALTGDTRTIDAERKFSDSFSFKNVARFFFTANDFIRVRAPDDAYFGRAYVIRCTNVFTPDKADPRIVDKLTTPANLSAGLNRALEGLQRILAQGGFTPASSMDQVNDEYRFSADTVSGFLHTCDFDSTFYITKQMMYQVYRATCEQGGRKPVSEDRFFKRIADSIERFGMTEEYKTLSDGTRQWCYAGRKPRALAGALVLPHVFDLTQVN